MSKTRNKPRTVSMRTIFAALVKELGEKEGPSIFEWYCSHYGVTIADTAPSVVAWEVLGI